jgi:hypothetical protein
MNKSEMDLFAADDVSRYESEWRTVQAGFVDDPEAAVRDADKLVQQVMDTVASKLRERRADLTTDGNGDSQRTEQLRVALRRYRTMFQQLTGLSSRDNGRPEPATSTTVRPTTAKSKSTTAEPTTAEPDRSMPMNGNDPNVTSMHRDSQGPSSMRGVAERTGPSESADGRGESAEHRAVLPDAE